MSTSAEWTGQSRTACPGSRLLARPYTQSGAWGIGGRKARRLLYDLKRAWPYQRGHRFRLDGLRQECEQARFLFPVPLTPGHGRERQGSRRPNGAGGSKPSPTAGVIAVTVGAKPARQRTGNVSLPCPRRYAAVPRSWACRVRMPIAGCRRLGWGIHKRDPSRCSPAASPQARHTFLCLAHSSTTGLPRLARLAGEEERVSAFLDVIMQMHPQDARAM